MDANCLLATYMYQAFVFGGKLQHHQVELGAIPYINCTRTRNIQQSVCSDIDSLRNIVCCGRRKEANIEPTIKSH